MEKNMSAILSVCLVALLVLTGGFSYLLGTNNAETKEVTVYEDKIEYVDKEVEKLVNVSVFEPSILLDSSVELFEKEIEDEEDLQECNGNEYDENQVRVKKVYDDYSINLDEDITEVNFKVKLKYLDDDVEEKCYNTYNVLVVYEDGEDDEVEYDLD